MKSMLDSQCIDIPCPHCGHQLGETLGKLKTNPTLVCPSCKGSTEVDATDLRSKIAGIEKQLADLGKSLGRLGK